MNEIRCSQFGDQTIDDNEIADRFLASKADEIVNGRNRTEDAPSPNAKERNRYESKETKTLFLKQC